MNSLKIIDDHYNALLKSLMDEKMQKLEEALTEYCRK